MTVDQAHEIADAMSFGWNIDVEVRENYSGRFMYGEEVPALVFDNLVDLLYIGVAMSEAGLPYEDTPRRLDQMGMGHVLY